jgi:hypothetical protein
LDGLLRGGGRHLPKHWESLGLDREHIKPDLDYERYAKLDEMEMMHCVTARADGKLVGYIICFLIIHMHYKSSGMMALADMYYILPEYRVGGLGAKMFMEMERGLRANNITRAHMSCKTHEDHSQLFIKMGWKLTDYTFSKFLKAGN